VIAGLRFIKHAQTKDNITHVRCSLVGEQAQLVTSKSSWMDGGMQCHLPPAAPAASCRHILKQICMPSRQRHQYLQAHKGSARRATRADSEHQHRQVRGDPAVRPDTPLPGQNISGPAGRQMQRGGEGSSNGLINRRGLM
jgi:hypothetical protein